MLQRRFTQMRKHLIVILAALAASTLPGATATQQPSTKLGMLDCVIEGGTGFIVGSTKDLARTFTPANNKVPPETYMGVVKKFGLDVGRTNKTVMRWLVFAPTEFAYDPGA